MLEWIKRQYYKLEFQLLPGKIIFEIFLVAPLSLELRNAWVLKTAYRASELYRRAYGAEKWLEIYKDV